MSSHKTRSRFALVAAGLVLLTAAVLISLPFAGVLAFLVRFVVLLAVPVFILAVIMSPGLRAWLNEEPASATANSKGLIVPSRVMLFDRHSWARSDGLSRVTVGADDLLQRVVGPVDDVELPEVGKDVMLGDPLFTVRHEGREVTVRAPVSGTVVRTNGELENIPGLVNTSPYDLGWAVVLKPAALGRERKLLHRFDEAKAWFQGEVDGLIGRLSPAMLPAPALQDGGAIVDDLHLEIDDETFEAIARDMF